MLDSKKRLLIQSLSENIYHTSEELGELLGVSSKTARSMVKAVREELEQNGAVVEAKSRKGFRLVITDREKFDRFCHPEATEQHFVPNTGEERVFYILVMLLSQVDYIKLEDIADELFVSKYTITGDLHRVEVLLGEYSLEILRRPNYGIKVTGRETDIRNCMAHILGRHNGMMADGGEGYRRMTKQISQLLLEAVQMFDLHFSEFSFRNITNMICASMHRMNNDFDAIYEASFQLIGIAGDSKAESMAAIECAKTGDFEGAEKHLAAADKSMVEAHESQTAMLQQEAEGNPVAVNIILVHAQDHLTMAQMARDMADQMIALYKEIRK